MPRRCGGASRRPGCRRDDHGTWGLRGLDHSRADRAGGCGVRPRQVPARNAPICHHGVHRDHGPPRHDRHRRPRHALSRELHTIVLRRFRVPGPARHLGRELLQRRSPSRQPGQLCDAHRSGRPRAHRSRSRVRDLRPEQDRRLHELRSEVRPRRYRTVPAPPHGRGLRDHRKLGQGSRGSRSRRPRQARGTTIRLLPVRGVGRLGQLLPGYRDGKRRPAGHLQRGRERPDDSSGAACTTTTTATRSGAGTGLPRT